MLKIAIGLSQTTNVTFLELCNSTIKQKPNGAEDSQQKELYFGDKGSERRRKFQTQRKNVARFQDFLVPQEFDPFSLVKENSHLNRHTYQRLLNNPNYAQSDIPHQTPQKETNFITSPISSPLLNPVASEARPLASNAKTPPHLSPQLRPVTVGTRPVVSKTKTPPKPHLALFHSPTPFKTMDPDGDNFDPNPNDVIYLSFDNYYNRVGTLCALVSSRNVGDDYFCQSVVVAIQAFDAEDAGKITGKLSEDGKTIEVRRIACHPVFGDKKKTGGFLDGMKNSMGECKNRQDTTSNSILDLRKHPSGPYKTEYYHLPADEFQADFDFKCTNNSFNQGFERNDNTSLEPKLVVVKYAVKTSEFKKKKVVTVKEEFSSMWVLFEVEVDNTRKELTEKKEDKLTSGILRSMNNLKVVGDTDSEDDSNEEESVVSTPKKAQSSVGNKTASRTAKGNTKGRETKTQLNQKGTVPNNASLYGSLWPKANVTEVKGTLFDVR